LVTTALPSAPSVGASIVANSAIANTDRSSTSSTPTAKPNRIVSQQSRRQPGALPQHADVSVGGIREQHERQRHLGETANRLPVGLPGKHVETDLADEEPEDHEDDRPADPGALDGAGYRAVGQREHCQQGQGFIHRRLLDSRAPIELAVKVR
jgi:hypothetical protein